VVEGARWPAASKAQGALVEGVSEGEGHDSASAPLHIDEGAQWKGEGRMREAREVAVRCGSHGRESWPAGGRGRL
jgi:hypothetical protein